MDAEQALRLLLRACRETLDDARADVTWLGESVLDLERLCGRLEAELDARLGSA
ncbi:MAG: hypothetical protein M3321_02195 [Actinomycetota bacterium]|nr:hypothetical protein [Actinomycetota bacterium]